MQANPISRSRGPCSLLAGALLLSIAWVPQASAVFVDPNLPIATQLLSFGPDGINADIYLPLTDGATTSTESGAPAATGDNYGWVLSNLRVDLSDTTDSTGEARLSVPFDTPNNPDIASNPDRCIEGGQAGNVQDGDTVCVNSFFDVSYKVTVTDIDGSTGFFGGAGPAMVEVDGLGPERVNLFGDCVADTSLPNLGCLPPSGFPYIGHFEIVIPLPDVNENGEADVMKMTFGAHNVGGVTNTFVDGNRVVDEFESTMVGNGAVQDAITDPPFSFTLSGPTTAQQDIVFSDSVIPLPGTALLLVGGLAVMGLRRR